MVLRMDVRYATDVVSSMGYGEFTPSDLTKVTAGKSISVGVSFGDVSNNVSGSSTVKDLEDMFQLLYLKLTQPRINEDLF